LCVMRQYAPFFEWFEKDRKELGVVEELLESINRTTAAGLHSPRIYKPDPPDCVCLDGEGHLVAIEVAEVVCAEAASRTARGGSIMRVWRPGDLADYVAQLLRVKDRKTYHGGPYRQIAVSLFTDEPMLTLQDVLAELKGRPFGPLRQVTAAYLLTSYEPRAKSYPVISLQVTQ
jgi:hypothetical protein